LRKDANASSTSGGGASHAARQASGLSAIYALNNVSYLRREVLLNSSVPDFLSSGAASRRASSSTTGAGLGGHSTNGLDIEDEMNRRNRSSRSAYLEIFSPLVSCLMDAGMEQSMLKSAIGVGNTEKKDTKDRFARFNDALEEVEQIHKLGKVDRSPENADFRARLKDEVVRMCVPTYTAFVRKHDNFSKSERLPIASTDTQLTHYYHPDPSKYLKIDPQGLQGRLESLFE
jgi:exocyst complex protein 7